MSTAIDIIDVTPRDGLQIEKQVVSTEDKVELITRLADAGARRIEAVSFVHPRRVPTMADAEAVMERVPVREDVSYIGLALNTRGILRALETSVDEVNFVLPITDAFAEANQGGSTGSLLAELETALPDLEGSGKKLSVTLAVAFGCPYQGEVPIADVVRIAGTLLDAAPLDELAIADTIGCGVPGQAQNLFEQVGALSDVPLRAHFHDTRRTAIANVAAARAAGVRRFDSSVAGLGGCPFAPGAAGNVATEDLVWALERDGCTTGIDLESAVDTGRWITGILGKEPGSGIAAAGPFPAGR
ncbi:hydroxymethylglutaryl-CoA lyase [Brevibacterium yomogidense]|uniref:Hydroxymethylglutaryl-CoA lyase n=1 Tax=Brevibacterium yomogidense TaxID=946573 RepID=A0A1X6WUM3_9MICO|nr:hydroxymethylglutaryl-CoA lyase [Brevibacterium yomogidense]SLM89023.1 Hydroxymethylglutaryl-CoA lyase [Brevibacterium yomogidense]